MTPASTLLVAMAAAWVAVCSIAARRFLQRSGSPARQPETALTLTAIGLLAVAPCTYLLLRSLMAAPTVVPSVIQLSAAGLLFVAGVRARHARLNPELLSFFTYPEKSAALALGAIVVIYGQYFFRTFGAEPAQVIESFIESVVLLIVVMIVGHIVVAILHAPIEEIDSGPDERDVAVKRLGIRNAHYALLAGYWTLPILIILPLPVAMVLNLWFLFLVASEVVYYGSIIAGYRLGTD